MKESKQRLEVIFHNAKELTDVEQREIYLRDACKDAPEIRNKVEQLLKASAESESLFGCKTAEIPPDTATMQQASIAEGPGSRIGRYKLLQRLGEGGMGAVFMAEQTEPVTRKVALKIIKLGMDTRNVVARFEAERQALAMMDHPNIAKVLDAGATDSGRPYFVMELVRGVPITEYCDKNKLSTLDRLKLFIPVCQAIQHAHHKGIIHRDVKPSNVMVTLHDGTPVPKVIDFGIAKATNQKLTEKTLFTNYAQMIGTPAYMSPEQAEMSGLDVDTRTDVYSLGVLLYELLTGTTPFPSKELLSMGYGEMQRVISESEPPKPSTRMSTMHQEDRTTVAKNRSIDDSLLDATFRGDLDWIVMKSLEKDRTQRYETVNGLVEDIQRHLNNEPVTAAAPTFAYQFNKFYRRNQGYMQAASMVAILLTAIAAFASFQAIRANRMVQKVENLLEEKTRESVRGDMLVDHIIHSLEEQIAAFANAGKHTSIIEVLEDTSDLAEKTLSNTPAAELKLRMTICRFFRSYLWDTNRALKEVERMESLIEGMGESELGGALTDFKIEFLQTRMWAAYRNETKESGSEMHLQETVEFEAFFQQIQSLDVKDSRAIFKSATYLAGFFLEIGMHAKAVEYLSLAIPEISNNSDDSIHQYLRNVIYSGLNENAPFQELEKKLPETKLPTFKGAFFNRFWFGHQLSRHWHYLFIQGKLSEADELLTKTRAQIERTGDEIFSMKFRSMHARFYLHAGNEQKALELIQGLESNENLTFWAWGDLLSIAARTEALELYDHLRIIGFTRFASEVDRRYGRRFAMTAMCHPISQDLLKILENLILRLAESGRDLSVFDAWGSVTLNSLHAYRSGDYDKALSILEPQLTVRQGEAVDANTQEPWIWYMIGAMAYSKLDRSNEALAHYQHGLQIRDKTHHSRSIISHAIFDLLKEEAEQILEEDGFALQ